MKAFLVSTPMSNFKIRKIRQHQSRSRIWGWMLEHLGSFGAKTIAVVLILSIVIFFLVFWLPSGLWDTVKNISGAGLPTDLHGRTNVLVLGVAGDSEEGGLLTDSIMVVSLDVKKGSFNSLSLPRDLYVHSPLGDSKINEIYSRLYALGLRKFLPPTPEGREPVRAATGLAALDITREQVAEFLQMEIHYGAVINFQVFEKIIDELGGIDLFIPEDIEDPYYPTDNYGFQTFTIRRGIQHLDGATALKYVRSRKTTSDYNRSKRQQMVLRAIADKALSAQIITDIGKIKRFFYLYRQNVVTDIDIGTGIALATVMAGSDPTQGHREVLSNDPSVTGGLLYAPGLEKYDGQFVLIPENEEDIPFFVHLNLLDTSTLDEKAQIIAQNATKKEGHAWETESRLRQMGFLLSKSVNYEKKEGEKIPVVQLKDITQENPKTRKFLIQWLGISDSDVIDVEPLDRPKNITEDFEIILGRCNFSGASKVYFT